MYKLSMTTDSAFSEIRELLSHPISIVGVLAVGLLTVILLLISEVTGITTVADQASISLVGIVINGLLTVFLLTIYAEMRTTQIEQRNTEEAQKELQEEIVGLQHSLTSMESEPQVVMERLQLSSSKEKDLALTLSNVGRGFARNLRVTIDAEIYRGTDVDVEFATYTESLERMREGDDLVNGGDYLMPNEDDVGFEFPAYVEIVYKELGPDIPHYGTYKINQIPEAIFLQDFHSDEITPEELGCQCDSLNDVSWTTEDAIDRYDIQLVNMTIGLVYRIVDGKERTQELTEYIVPVCEKFSTEEALREGITREEYEWGLNNKGDFFNSLEGYNRSLAREKGPAETRPPLDI